MIQVQDFNLEALKTHKAFFLLDNLPKNASEVDVWIQTPAGLESVDFVSVFKMQDGSLLAAWEHPTQKLPLHNLTAYCEGQTQIVNIYTVERVIDIYDRPVDSDIGTFHFVASTSVPGGDWRCDRGMYGPIPFPEENVETLLSEFNEFNQLLIYESILNVNNVFHITYMEATGRSSLAHEKLNNSNVPITGRTFQEVLRLIYEWSVLANEPFNSTEKCATIADEFFKKLSFTEEEMNVVKAISPMQISQFILGSSEARVRPSSISSMNSKIANILFRRMSSSSLSFIIARNTDLWDFEEIYNAELEELEKGMARFREYYGVPEYEPLNNESRASEFAKVFVANQDSYIHNQLRGFKNKDTVMKIALSIHQQKL